MSSQIKDFETLVKHKRYLVKLKGEPDTSYKPMMFRGALQMGRSTYWEFKETTFISHLPEAERAPGICEIKGKICVKELPAGVT